MGRRRLFVDGVKGNVPDQRAAAPNPGQVRDSVK